MPFNSGLVAKLIYEGKERDVWELYEDLEYEGNGLHILVRKGFQTDFASIPRKWWAPQIWYEFGYRFKRQAVIHDYLYRIDSVPNCHQDVADNHLDFMLEEAGYSEVDRWAVHTAVENAGGASFHKLHVTDPLPHEMVD
jgi:hypothetical protein